MTWFGWLGAEVVGKEHGVVVSPVYPSQVGPQGVGEGGQRYSFNSHLGLRRGAYGRQLRLGQGWVTYVTRRILGLVDLVKNFKTFLGPIRLAFILCYLMRR